MDIIRCPQKTSRQCMREKNARLENISVGASEKISGAGKPRNCLNFILKSRRLNNLIWY